MVGFGVQCEIRSGPSVQSRQAVNSISISDKFATLIQRIAPTPAENSAFSSHLKTVSAAAEAVLEINRTERIGSFSRGTAVRRQTHRLRPLPRKLRHPAHRSRAEVRLGEGLARVAVRFRDKSVPEPGELE